MKIASLRRYLSNPRGITECAMVVQGLRSCLAPGLGICLIAASAAYFAAGCASPDEMRREPVWRPPPEKHEPATGPQELRTLRTALWLGMDNLRIRILEVRLAPERTYVISEVFPIAQTALPSWDWCYDEVTILARPGTVTHIVIVGQVRQGGWFARSEIREPERGTEYQYVETYQEALATIPHAIHVYP